MLHMRFFGGVLCVCLMLFGPYNPKNVQELALFSVCGLTIVFLFFTSSVMERRKVDSKVFPSSTFMVKLDILTGVIWLIAVLVKLVPYF